ncbi:MAG: mevalonate kinase [Planctomycetota bacterium]
MIIRSRSHPRAALIGNPSDGYHGKTIAFLFADFHADVELWETPEVEILPNERDQRHFGSIHELVEDVRQFGYYGGLRLLKATVRVFARYCHQAGIELHRRNFTIRYATTIPAHLGLAGSSAIITAGMRALMVFYGVTITPSVLANLVHSVEARELFIPAGLQDRVAQAFETPVFMDFAEDHMRAFGHGVYEPLPADALPPLYVAWRTDLAEGSEVLHGDLRQRYNRNDEQVHAAMREWMDLTTRARELILAGRGAEIGPLLDRNYDLREEICQVSRRNAEMVHLAREVGVSTKFTGSGGAIIGVCETDEKFAQLKAHLSGHGVDVLRPTVVDRSR